MLFEEQGWRFRPSLQQLDAPEHKAIRSLVDKAFAHWNIKTLYPFVESVINDLIDAFEDQGKCEFVGDFAVGLTIKMIANQLGVVANDPEQFERDATALRVWSDHNVALLTPGLPPERQLEWARHAVEFQHFCVANIRRVLARPDDTLLSKLVEVVLDENGEPDLPELISIMRSLLVAGNETSRFALASGIKALTEDPALAREIRDDPAKIDLFVEEVLRTMSPIQTLFRRAAEDFDLDGTTIPAGSQVEVRYGAANRDPRAFQDPERIDLFRTIDKPHLAFGAGVHSCIGMELARAELRFAFRHLLRRLENLRPARGEESFEYTTIYISWGLTRLDLAFDKRR